MSSELNEQIRERFIKAIQKSFKPCPLIGPKWLQEYPNGRPADFRFIGIPKLAKAAGRSVEKTRQILMKNLSLKSLNVDMEIIKGCYIDLNVKGKPCPEPPKQNSNPPQTDKMSKAKKTGKAGTASETNKTKVKKQSKN